jgi:hypothetical protein
MAALGWKMPALATTMSSLPSWATPSSTASFSPLLSLDLLDRLGQVFLGRRRVDLHRVDRPGDVDGDDVRALFRQPDSVTAALAARRPGDEGDLARYSSWHVVSPLTSCW